jgi:hypothetical protein
MRTVDASKNQDNTEAGLVLEKQQVPTPPMRRTTTSGTPRPTGDIVMTTHRIALLGGACLCASLLTAGSALAQTPETTSTIDPSASRRDIPVDAAPTPDIELAEAPAARRILEDEARHRDRVARLGRLREIYRQRDDRARLARLDDIERRELDRHEARQLRERRGLSERTVRGLDDIVRRGGRFQVHARDIAVARERMRGVDRRDLDRREADRTGRDLRASRRPADTARRPPTHSGSDTRKGSDSSRGPR